MSNYALNKIATCIIVSLMIGACAPLVPSNYLGPTNIHSSQTINGQQVEPRFIPISTQMLNTPMGRELLEPALKPQPYRVGAYDNLNIIVWGHAELSTVAIATAPLPGQGGTHPIEGGGNNVGVSNPAILVQSDGTIFYPYIGTLKVSDLTINEIQKQMTQRLLRYMRNPQVSVQVAKFRNRNAYVLGEVQRPGAQPLTDKPLTLMEAISNAGDINGASADPGHIYLIRGSYMKPDIFWLDAQTPQSLMIAEQFPLQENDIVYVSAASLTGLNHFLNQILPSLTTYTIAKGLN